MAKAFHITVIILLFLTSINAIVAGALFIADPSGKLLGMTTDYLKFSPFKDFLIPGIVLLTVNGIFNAITGTLCIKKRKNHESFVLFQGIILCGWILIQILLVREVNILHICMFSIGVVFLAYSWVFLELSRQ